MHSGHSTTQTVRYSRTLRVSDTADDENRKTCWPIPVAGPMRHAGEVLSAQFSVNVIDLIKLATKELKSSDPPTYILT